MMKQTLLFLTLALSTHLNAFSQTTLISEDFSSASGTTPPVGWTIQTVTGDPVDDVWHFDNPGRRTSKSPILANFASFDSDKYSNNDLAEEVYLISPTFDATTEGSIFIEFDQYFFSGTGGQCELEVFNGSSWVNIYSNTNTTTNSQHSRLEITSDVRNVTNTQFRFKWIGNYSWYWIVDNVQVFVEPYSGEQFSPQNTTSFEGYYANSTWIDYDNDGDLDIVPYGGKIYSAFGLSEIYRNDGDNSFSVQSLSSEYPINWGRWFDYDNDGDMDFAAITTIEIDFITENYLKIIRNNISDSSGFTTVSSIYLGESTGSEIFCGDYDNDGLIDILMGDSFSGLTTNAITVYKNIGNDSFLEMIYPTTESIYNNYWADYDNDGDLDVLVSGVFSGSTISTIYNNEGSNGFVKSGITISDYYMHNTKWGDFDNDGDLDVVAIDRSENTIDFYRNNLSESFGFSNILSLSFNTTGDASFDWGDFDNDGDLDLLFAGEERVNDWNDTERTRVYMNTLPDSIGFIEQTDFGLLGTNRDAKWGDYDRDGDLDIFLNAPDYHYNETRIYRNNTTILNSLPEAPLNLQAAVDKQKISFTWDKSNDFETPTEALSYNIYVSSEKEKVFSVSPMADIISGNRRKSGLGNCSLNNYYDLNSSLPAGKYYWGIQTIDQAYGASNFALDSFEIVDVQAARVTANDISTYRAVLKWKKEPGSSCAVFVKHGDSGLPEIADNTSYTADHIFERGDVAGDGWYCVYNGEGDSVLVEGLSGGNPYKVFVAGYSGIPSLENYKTQTNGSNPILFQTSDQFTLKEPKSLPSYKGSTGDWGDFNGDGNLDVLYTGYFSNSSKRSLVYLNSGSEAFEFSNFASLTGISYGTTALGDYDNDGDLDFIIGGTDGHRTPYPHLYRNDNGAFVEIEGLSLIESYNSKYSWGDYDNDGDLDLLISGRNDASQSVSHVYKNEGADNFLYQTEITLNGYSYSSSFNASVWIDFDVDGDLDILIGGSLYMNNGINEFSLVDNTGIPFVSSGSFDWGDYNSDGLPDILISGYSYVEQKMISIVCKNNGDGNFSVQSDIELVGLNYSSAAWGDYDNDGDLDIMLGGQIANNVYDFKIYQNDGDNSFTEVLDLPAGIRSCVWGDYDNDTDLDFLLSDGNIYKNNSSKRNTQPTAPSDVMAYVNENNLYVSWNKSSDLETPQAALTYNLRIGTTPGGNELMASMSTESGKRTIVDMGNVQFNNAWTISLPSPLPENIYYSVQAVDNGYLASEWSEEQSSVFKFAADFIPTAGCQFDSIQFSDISYSVDYEITAWKWFFKEGGIVKDSSLLQNPLYAFSAYGAHDVILKVTNSNNETVERTKSVTILPSPIADFEAPIVCEGNLTSIANTTLDNNTNTTDWSWNFGDGSQSSLEKEAVSHGYSAGVYWLSLTATGNNGCSNKKVKLVEVASIPSKTLSISGSQTFCPNESLTIYTEEGENYLYQWYSDGILIQDSVRNRLNPTTTGIYSVDIVNSSVSGCENITNPVAVSVLEGPSSPTISLDGNTQICQGDSVKLWVSNNNLYSYEWKLNGGSVGSDSPTYTVRNEGEYIVEVTNPEGCTAISFNQIDIITSGAPPAPLINMDGDSEFCHGDSVLLSVSRDPLFTYQWTLNSDEITGAESNSYTVEEDGGYTLIVSNANGCGTTSPVFSFSLKDAPAEPIIFANTELEICEGDSVKLSFDEVQGCTSIWLHEGVPQSANQGSFYAKLNGEYSIQLENAIRCKSSSKNTIDLLVNPAPAQTVIGMSGSPIFCEGDAITLSVTEEGGLNYQWFNEHGNIANQNTTSLLVSESGNYGVKISTAFECELLPELVEVLAAEAPIMQSVQVNGMTHICPGDEVEMSVEFNDNYTYQWKLDGVDIKDAANDTYIGTTQGKYNVDISNYDCSVSTSPTEITYKPSLPKPLLTAEGPMVWYLACDNASAQVYRWYHNGVLVPDAAEYVYVAEQQLGEYVVSVNDGGECHVASDIIRIPLSATGIDEESVFGIIKIYPNPTPGVFLIDMENQIIGSFYIRIISESGKELFRLKQDKVISSLQTQMDLSGQGNGIYFIEFIFGNDRAIRKIVVE